MCVCVCERGREGGEIQKNYIVLRNLTGQRNRERRRGRERERKGD